MQRRLKLHFLLHLLVLLSLLEHLDFSLLPLCLLLALSGFFQLLVFLKNVR